MSPVHLKKQVMKKLILLPLFSCLLTLQTKAQSFYPDIDCPVIGGSSNGSYVTVNFSNLASSNNYNELFDAWDPRIHNASDSTWDFEGYIVYQLHVTNCQLPVPFENFMFDTSVARVVAQCDIANGISTLINRDTGNSCAPVTMVIGADAGIQHSFTFTNDAFTGQPMQGGLYAYTVLAYAYNPYYSDSACSPLTSTFLMGHHQHIFCVQVTPGGVAENSGAEYLHVFPSPATNFLTVDLTPFHKEVTLSVRDIAGKLLKEVIVSGEANRELDLSELAPGTYFLEAVSGEKCSFSRFVKE
jgi:hypothetical protein